MPEITLSGGPQDGYSVMDIMLFPNDAKLRERSALLRLVGQRYEINEDSDIVQIDVATIRSLIKGPSFSELSPIAIEAVKTGTHAGFVLLALYLQERFRGRDPAFDEPSMRKALWAAETFAKSTVFGDDDPMLHSDGKVRSQWIEFKAVAHLWAAYFVCKASSPGKSYKIPTCGEQLHAFLGLALDFYNLGATFLPTRRKKPMPFFDPKTCWRIPSDVALQSLVFETVPSEFVDIIKSYRA